MNKSHQTFKHCVSLSRVKSLAKNNFRASITGRKWACESLQIHQQVRRSYWDTKAEKSSSKPKRWIFGPLFGSGDFRGATVEECERARSAAQRTRTHASEQANSSSSESYSSQPLAHRRRCACRTSLDSTFRSLPSK